MYLSHNEYFNSTFPILTKKYRFFLKMFLVQGIGRGTFQGSLNLGGVITLPDTQIMIPLAGDFLVCVNNNVIFSS